MFPRLHHYKILLTSLLYVLVSIGTIALLASSCKKNKDTPDGNLSALSPETVTTDTLAAVRSMQPGEFAITFDDGPLLPLGSGCKPEKITKPEPKKEEMSSLALELQKAAEKRQQNSNQDKKLPPPKPQPKPKSTQVSQDPPSNSADLVHFLKEHNIPATLFIVASRLLWTGKDADCMIQNVLQTDHILLANHTWSHRSSAIDPRKCNKELVDSDGDGKWEKGDDPDPMAYSRLFSSEVESAHCLIDRKLKKAYGENNQKVRDYPLFFRPPGGFWEKEEQNILLTRKFQDTYIGPVGWIFGSGPLAQGIPSDYECWQVRYEWNKADLNKRKNIIETHPKLLTDALQSEEPYAVEKACSDLHMQYLMKKAPEDRKGIILLHDIYPSSIIMFTEFLYPALKEQSFTFVSLADIPYYKEQIAKHRQSANIQAMRNMRDIMAADLESISKKTTFSPDTNCAAIIQTCSCCSEDNTSCCP